MGEIEKTENTEQLDEPQVSDPPSAGAQGQAVVADVSHAEPASLAAPVPAAAPLLVGDDRVDGGPRRRNSRHGVHGALVDVRRGYVLTTPEVGVEHL